MMNLSSQLARIYVKQPWITCLGIHDIEPSATRFWIPPWTNCPNLSIGRGCLHVRNFFSKIPCQSSTIHFLGLCCLPRFAWKTNFSKALFGDCLRPSKACPPQWNRRPPNLSWWIFVGIARQGVYIWLIVWHPSFLLGDIPYMLTT